MELISTIAAMQQYSQNAAREGKTVGVVPTMGYLHAGHVSLIKRAQAEVDKVIVTLFVNPTQFGPAEDFSRYPRSFDADWQQCLEAGADVLFAPEAAEMYCPDSSTWVIEEKLTRGLCGKSRPTHFRGVTTVVAKLFNATLPDVAVFGQKDAQQALVIQRMVRDLNFPVKIIIAPIVREADGLAMSSRNKYLSADERARAVVISASIFEAERDLRNADLCTIPAIINRVNVAITNAGGLVDYVELLDADTLEAVVESSSQLLLAVAAFFGKTRLIDNVVISRRSNSK
jgi:pantoate--beta-alanine ligase